MTCICRQNQKRSYDFFRIIMSCQIELREEIQENCNKNGIWSDYILSSSYAIMRFSDIY